MSEQREWVEDPVEPSPDLLGKMIRELDKALGSERYTLMRVRPGDWEVRPISTNAVGRGHTASDAIADLLKALDDGAVTRRKQRHATIRPLFSVPLPAYAVL